MGFINRLAGGIHDVVTGTRDAIGNAVDAITERYRVQEGIKEYYEGQSFLKLNMPERTGKILNVTDVTMREKTYKVAPKGDSPAWNALTRTLFDTSTYPDRAAVTLTNNRGFPVFLVSLSLYGKRVMQYSGESGELIHDSLKRDDDIRRNGEKVFEVGNEFIVDATQVANIADYWYKFLGKKKHMYAVQIPGFAYWYEVGDWYNFQVGEADTNEYIDTVVEVYAVDVEKAAGGIGTTSLLLREVEESWAKSTLYATRLATGGSPKRRVNRSNIVTVASSEYDGTYDYKCDGIDDDVQIQAAIDYLLATFGGGEIVLTLGTFSTGSTLDVPTGICISGAGYNTKIIGDASSFNTIVITGDNVGLSNIYFEKPVSSTYRLIRIEGDFATLNNCYLQDDCIVIGNNATITNCSILSRYNGFSVSGSNTQLVNNQIEYNLTEPNIIRKGISIVGSSVNCIVSNNIFGQHLDIGNNSTCYAINVDNLGSVGSHQITGNQIGQISSAVAAGCKGIYILSDNCIVSNNKIESITDTGAGTGYGIHIQSGSDRTNVTGNTALNSDTNFFDNGTNTSATGNITS